MDIKKFMGVRFNADRWFVLKVALIGALAGVILATMFYVGVTVLR
jgi:hypothetical protein